jgi:hypothetical protein
MATGLRIVAIHNQRRGATNPDDEWVQINNDGSETFVTDGWEVTDETDRQIDPHIFKLPRTLANGQTWRFEPGETTYIFSGSGSDVFIAQPSGGGRPQYHLYWGRRAMVWNNTGDRVYLRNEQGQFVTEPYPVP